jgi:hypothetical protein
VAQFTGSFSSYDAATGIREELSDLIYNISPTDTPFMSNVGRGSVGNTHFEWLTDSLTAASSSNFVIEGDDLTSYTTASARVRLGNYTAISTKTVLVTDTQREVNNAGVSEELAYQVAKMGKELKRDMEKILCGPQPAVAGNDTTARKTAGFEAFLRTNTARSSTSAGDPTLSGTTSGYPDAAPDDGTARAFSETILKEVVQAIWTAGGTPKMCIVGPFNKAAASGFTGIADIRKDAPGARPATVIGAADVYVSDFGNVTFVPSRFSRDQSALFVDPEYAEVVFLQPFMLKEMARTGLAEKRVLSVEYGLKVGTEAAHGVAADLTTA